MDSMVISAKEAAKQLKIDHTDVYRKLESGEIPAYREGKNWKIPVTLLQKYIEEKAEEESRIRREVNVQVYEEE